MAANLLYCYYFLYFLIQFSFHRFISDNIYIDFEESSVITLYILYGNILGSKADVIIEEKNC